MAVFLDYDLVEFLDMIENEDFEREPQPPRRYVRDAENPMEFYSDNEFVKRYRFSKNTVSESILPLLQFREQRTQRGLPLPPILQILCALRFYATGDFQVSIILLKTCFF